MKNEMCQVYFDEKGIQMIKMPNGEDVPKIISSTVEQSVDEAHAGMAIVTITMWCKTK